MSVYNNMEKTKVPKITKIKSSKKNSYMSFDVNILNRNDPQIQVVVVIVPKP